MSAFTQIFSTSIEDVKNKFPLYLKYLASPFIAILLYEIFWDSIDIISIPSIELAPASNEMPAVTLDIQGFFSDTIGFIIYTYLELNLAFITHKITLNKQSEISIIDGLIWRKKHIPFIKAFLTLLLISLLMLPPMFIFINIDETSKTTDHLTFLIIALSLYLLAIIYLLSRYSLIAPAAAANKPIKLSDSFLLSKGYGWIIMILVFIIPSLFNYLLDILPLTLSIILANIFLIFSIILLTNCYKYLKEKQVSITTAS